jgi:tetratricopeptide (TPR) repeat protein
MSLNFVTPLCGVVIAVAISCTEKKETIVNRADYNTYLMFKKTSAFSIEEDIQFWKERLTKLPNNEVSLIKIASLQSALFHTTGRIEALKASDSIYTFLLQQASVSKTSIYLALAQNAITQHQFAKAREYAELALETGERKATALMVLADACLELGNIPRAKLILKKFTNKNSFAHRIRQAKVHDQEGHLDSAIYAMEKAFERIKGNQELFCWSKSNLADMYGHAGRIKDAYRAYLEVLQKNPNYDYALKGISWIALSHDHHAEEAKRIINILSSKKSMPEAHLLLAEVAALQNDEAKKINQLMAFVRKTDTPELRTMYAKYLCEVYAGDLMNPQASLTLANQEVLNRPTPQSYDLLAWAQLNLGNAKGALSIIQKHVEGKTFEPDAAYHMGMIYLANEKTEKATEYLEQALEASFELGPSLTKSIQKALAEI